jgi:hypothetical protein
MSLGDHNGLELNWAAGCRPAGGLDGGAAGCSFLTFAAGQRFFKTGTASGFADNAIKLHLAVEALEHTLETLVILGSNLGQKNHPFPSGLTMRECIFWAIEDIVSSLKKVEYRNFVIYTLARNM